MRKNHRIIDLRRLPWFRPKPTRPWKIKLNLTHWCTRSAKGPLFLVRVRFELKSYLNRLWTPLLVELEQDNKEVFELLLLINDASICKTNVLKFVLWVCLDTAYYWKLKTYCWKYCSKIIFKCVNNTVGSSFKVTDTFFRTS